MSAHRPRSKRLASVPVLVLDLLRNDGATQSAPTPDGKSPRPPICPRCRTREKTAYCQWWDKLNEVIWVCSNRRPGKTDRCEFKWVDSQRTAPCLECGLPLVIEQHYGILGYACLHCKEWNIV